MAARPYYFHWKQDTDDFHHLFGNRKQKSNFHCRRYLNCCPSWINQICRKPFSFMLSTVSLRRDFQWVETKSQTFCFLWGYVISWVWSIANLKSANNYQKQLNNKSPGNNSCNRNVELSVYTIELFCTSICNYCKKLLTGTDFVSKSKSYIYFYSLKELTFKQIWPRLILHKFEVFCIWNLLFKKQSGGKVRVKSSEPRKCQMPECEQRQHLLHQRICSLKQLVGCLC